MSDNTTEKKVTLKSNDGIEFVVSETVAKQSTVICSFIEAHSVMDPIPILNVNAQILKMVIKYCKKCVKAADEAKNETTKEGSGTTQMQVAADEASSRISDKELRIWDELFGGVDMKTLLSLINAANYLNIQGLLNMTCKKVASKMEGMRVEEIRQAFNITKDYTAEEEEEIRQKHHWAFE